MCLNQLTRSTKHSMSEPALKYESGTRYRDQDKKEAAHMKFLRAIDLN